MENQSIGFIKEVFTNVDIDEFKSNYNEIIELSDSDSENDKKIDKSFLSLILKNTDKRKKVVKQVKKKCFKPILKTYGFIQDENKVICLFCGAMYTLGTTSAKPHYMTKHSLMFINEEDKSRAIQQNLEEYNRCKLLNDPTSWLEAVRAQCARYNQIDPVEIDKFLEKRPKNQLDGNVQSPQQTTSILTSTENTYNVGTMADSTLKPKEKRLAVECSYKLSQILAKNGKPFSDGEFVKESFLSCAEILFCDLPNKKAIIERIKNIPTSSKILELRYFEVASTYKNIRAKSLKESAAFSIALELNRDVSLGEGGALIILVIRFCGTENIYEELCNYKSYEYEPSGQEILYFVKSSFEQLNIDPKKMFSVITDNSPVFVDGIDGFVTLMECNLERELLKYHCLVDQERLISDISDGNLVVVMDSVKRILRFAMCNSTQIEEIFKPKLEDIGIRSYSNMGWLGRGEVLSYFITHLPDIIKLINEKKFNFPELSDMIWLNLLMYLTDITRHLNVLENSLKLQGQTLYDLFEQWKVFIVTLKSLICDVSTNAYNNLPFLHTFYEKHKFATGESLKYTESLLHEFSERLDTLYGYEYSLLFLIDPHSMDMSKIDPAQFPMLDLNLVRLQFAEFKNSIVIFDKFKILRFVISKNVSNRGAEILKCWSSLPDRFICLKNIAFTMLSSFGSVILNDEFHSLVISPLNQKLHVESINNVNKSTLSYVTKDATNYEPAIKRLCLISQMEG